MQNRFAGCALTALTQESAAQISRWTYPEPYAAYSFRSDDGFLFDRSTWGTEQFCLMDANTVVGQVAAQFDGEDLWVGWSLAPQLCGQGGGAEFVETCVRALAAVKKPAGRILLRVAAWNSRAIRAYEKAGFAYIKTIQDEIAHSNRMEDFWVMQWTDSSKKNTAREDDPQ